MTLRNCLVTKSVFFLLLACLLFTSGLTSALASGLSAQADRTSIAANESLTFTLTYQGQAMSGPDFSPLEQNFDILSRQQQSKLSLGFGNNNSTTEWVLALMPKRKGKLVIPSLTFKGEQSEAITITVSDARASNDDSQPIFVETELDTESAYVKGQTLLTLRLNTSVRISSLEVGDLVVPNAQAVKIAENQYQKLINGRDHIVVEIKYALFPDVAGTLTIPSIRISGVVPDRRDPFNSPFGGSSLFGSRGKTFHLASEEKSIEVLPIPPEASGHPWLPAKGVSISQRWSDRSKNLTVGEPVTRSITVSVQGQTGAQIPPIDMPTAGNYKLYPDQPEISESLSDSGIMGTRTESVAIVPTEPGTLKIPATLVHWWDTEAGVMRKTEIEAVTLDVAPAADTPQPQGPSTVATDDPNPEETGAERNPFSNRLLTLSLVANLLLLLMLFALAASGRRKPGRVRRNNPPAETQTSSEKQAFQSLRSTSADQRTEFRDRLLHWGRLFWPEQRVLTLDDIASLSQRPELKNLFANLDDSLYGSQSGQVDIKQIVSILKDVRKQSPAGNPDKRSAPLKSLYPDSNQA